MPWFVGNLAPCIHLICFLLLLVAHRGMQSQNCSEEITCRGDRPRLSTGCCPVEVGQICRTSIGENCDTELGFYCRDEEGTQIVSGEGICMGLSDLRVVSRGETIIDLEWRDFAPENYLFEYILLFREGSYDKDLKTWRRVEIGDTPSYSIQGLTPATLYFFSVAIWEDEHATALGNMSEILMVETRPVEYCEHRGDLYLVGEPFMHDCEDNCTCLATGGFHCTPLCEERGVPEVPEGCWIETGEGCCDYKVACPVGGEPCTYNGTVYNHEEEFEDNCRLCTCFLGLVQCEKALECPDQTCVYENKTYLPMELFTSTHCGLCRCNAQGEVECGPDCAPVELVLPDTTCPDPHIRKDGCCDTLHCFDPSLSKIQRVRRMFALSYSPVTLTLSFEVDPIQEINGVPLYCEYEILYSNTSSPFVTWHRRLVQPIDVRLHQDQGTMTMEPTEAFIKDSAIVVGDRAYVTISGMHPNTTYYVKIIALDQNRQDMSGVDKSRIQGNVEADDESVSAMVVVKTRPLENTSSCFLEGEMLLHGQGTTDKCHQTCVCAFGQITCESNCESESLVVARSPSCPRPQLEKESSHQCCPDWKCHPATSGCFYKGLLLAHGQSVTEGCQICSCNNSGVDCSSVCPPAGSSPRENCKLEHLEGQCCPVWMCAKEIHDPYAVQASMVLLIYGDCKNLIPQRSTEVKENVKQHVHSLCADSKPEVVDMCKDIQLKLMCRDDAEMEWVDHKRRKRETFYLPYNGNEIMAQFYINKNFSHLESKQETIKRVQLAAVQLYSLLNHVYEIVLPNNAVLIMSGRLEQSHTTYVCNKGFSFQSGQCVLSEVESIPAFGQRADDLKVSDITDSTATFSWSLLKPAIAQHVTAIEVQRRVRGEIEWMTNAHISADRKYYTITSLTPQTLYQARLLAVTRWMGQHKWPLGYVLFTTMSESEASVGERAILTLDKAVVQDTFVVLFWDPLPSELTSQIRQAVVSYKKAQSANYTFQEQVPTPLHTHVSLSDLEPDITYTAKMTVTMKSGTTTTSPPIHFVTSSKRLCISTELVVSVIVVCIVAAVVAVIVVIMCIMWRKGPLNAPGAEFVNKTYGISLEGDHKDIKPVASSSLDEKFCSVNPST